MATNPNSVKERTSMRALCADSRRDSLGHERQGDEHGAAGGDRAEWTGPTDQHVEHGDHQRDGSRQDRPDGEPLQTLAVVPDRRWHSGAAPGKSAHTAAIDQLMPPARTEKDCVVITKASPVASAATYTTITAGATPRPRQLPVRAAPVRSGRTPPSPRARRSWRSTGRRRTSAGSRPVLAVPP